MDLRLRWIGVKLKKIIKDIMFGTVGVYVLPVCAFGGINIILSI